MSHYSKLFKLLKLNSKQSIKVGMLVMGHSIAFMGVPLLFKGTQLVKNSEENENQEQPQTLYQKQKQKFHSLSLSQKYGCFYVGCFAYLIFLGYLTRLKIINQRKLQDSFTRTLRLKIFKRMFQEKHKYISTNIIVQKAMTDSYMITQSLAESYFQVIRGFLFSTGGMAMILLYFPNLTIITFTYASLFILRNYYFAKEIQEKSQSQITKLQNVSKELSEFSDNKKSIILSNSEKFAMTYFNQSLNENRKRLLDLADLKGKQVFFLETFGIGYLLSIICYGTYLIALGNLQTEDLALSIYAIYAALGIRGINTGYTELKEKNGILAEMEREIGIEICEVKDVYQSQIKNFEKFKRFEEFVFNHESNQFETISEFDAQVEDFLQKQRNVIDYKAKNLKFTVKNNYKEIQKELVDFEVKSDECIWIKGPSGVGKTSIFEILLGFRQPDSGSIEENKEDGERQSRSFYFTQQPEVFNKGFLFNVVIGNQDLMNFIFNQNQFTENEQFQMLLKYIKKSLQKANILHKFDKKHTGYLQNLSAGEKQRLVFARMFFSNPDSIFMDESFANLDHNNQDILSKEIRDFRKNRTLLVISHNHEIIKHLGSFKVYEIQELDLIQKCKYLCLIMDNDPEREFLRKNKHLKSKHDFKQQLLPGWKPKPTIFCSLFIFFGIGFSFLILGILLYIYTLSINSIEIRYDNKCKINPTIVCLVNFTLTKDFKAPIFLYYRVTNFYQNHRRFLAARDVKQLRGIEKGENLQNNCDGALYNSEFPFINDQFRTPNGNTLQQESIAIPCGMMARSYFNDTYSIENSQGKKYQISEKDISWSTDKYKFQNIDLSRQWIDMESERFINWMKISPFSNIYKIWGKINEDLPAGEYTMKIKSKWDVRLFDGRKFWGLTTTNKLGAENQFLSIAFIVVGGIGIFLGLVFVIRKLQRPKGVLDRKLYQAQKLRSSVEINQYKSQYYK